MAFVRVKRINGNEYAYLVENKSRKQKGERKVKQKTKKYLGRVYRFDRKDTDFFDIYTITDVLKYISERGYNGMLKDVVEWELSNHGFDQKEGIWQKEDCFIDMRARKVFNKNSAKAALAFNEGFLTSFGIKKILNFKKKDDESDVYNYAKLFVETGLNVPKEIFVGLCGKLGLTKGF